MPTCWAKATRMLQAGMAFFQLQKNICWPTFQDYLLVSLSRLLHLCWLKILAPTSFKCNCSRSCTRNILTKQAYESISLWFCSNPLLHIISSLKTKLYWICYSPPLIGWLPKPIFSNLKILSGVGGELGKEIIRYGKKSKSK